MDFYWALKDSPRKQMADEVDAMAQQELLKKSRMTHAGDESDYKQRILYGAAVQDFSLEFYLAYLCYIPLYLAGPIITFNDFASQVYKPDQGSAASNKRL